jgi:hypothetical protein
MSMGIRGRGGGGWGGWGGGGSGWAWLLGGGGCGLLAQGLPKRNGELEEGACDNACGCEVALPVDSPMGIQGACSLAEIVPAMPSTHDEPGSPGGTTSVTGTSPLALDYTIDLSGLGDNVRLMSVLASYTVSGLGDATVTDPGGSVTGAGGGDINWGVDGVRYVVANAGKTGVAVHADASWSGGGSRTFQATGVTITQLDI